MRFPVTPRPASRARVPRWGKPFFTGAYVDFRAEFEQNVEVPEYMYVGTLGVEAEYVCKRPQRVTRDCPVGDIDNYDKALFDAMTRKGFWEDDDQIVYSLTYKRYAEEGETPHINVEVWAE